MNFEMNDFSEDVIKKSYDIPVLVDFWAEWCGPCKALSPVLEKLAVEFNSSWKLVKINSDEQHDIAAQYGIHSIPNVKLFSGGKVINEFVGALPENMIRDWLKKAIPGKNEKKITTAETLISTGEFAKAEKVLEKILEEEPANQKAIVTLAKLIFFKDNEKSLSLIDQVDEEAEYFEIVESLKTFANLFQMQNNPNHLSDNPAKNLYAEAIADLQKQDFSSALNKFIEVIRIDRYFDEDGARKACIAIFKYLGEDNEITINHRRDFGRALYV